MTACCQMETPQPYLPLPVMDHIGSKLIEGEKPNDIGKWRVLSGRSPPRSLLPPGRGYFLSEKVDGKLELAKMIDKSLHALRPSPHAPSERLPKLSLPTALLAGFGPDCLAPGACASLLARLLNPQGVACPACGREAEPSTRLLAGGRVRCTGCGRRFTAFSGSILEGCKLSVQQAALLLLLLSLGHDNSTVAGLAGVSAETARAWRAKLETA